jgi:hypothetical protein
MPVTVADSLDEGLCTRPKGMLTLTAWRADGTCHEIGFGRRLSRA